MSQYGLPHDFDESWLAETFELSIETLTGTSFEIKVFPCETIMSLKSRIQRIEGIPMSQQHLLYNLKELDNSACIKDSIQNGAKLKLVLSMRGGPINTRRLSPGQYAALKFKQYLLCSNKEDIMDQVPSGSKIRVFVIRDGYRVNFFRVVENEDGTFFPLSKSLSGTSLTNLFGDDDSDDSDERLQENTVTMAKMQTLKEKLELQKKGKKLDEIDKEESESDDETEGARSSSTCEQVLNKSWDDLLCEEVFQFTGSPEKPDSSSSTHSLKLRHSHRRNLEELLTEEPHTSYAVMGRLRELKNTPELYTIQMSDSASGDDEEATLEDEACIPVGRERVNKSRVGFAEVASSENIFRFAENVNSARTAHAVKLPHRFQGRHLDKETGIEDEVEEQASCLPEGREGTNRGKLEDASSENIFRFTGSAQNSTTTAQAVKLPHRLPKTYLNGEPSLEKAQPSSVGKDEVNKSRVGFEEASSENIFRFTGSAQNTTSAGTAEAVKLPHRLPGKNLNKETGLEETQSPSMGRKGINRSMVGFAEETSTKNIFRFTGSAENANTAHDVKLSQRLLRKNLQPLYTEDANHDLVSLGTTIRDVPDLCSIKMKENILSEGDEQGDIEEDKIESKASCHLKNNERNTGSRIGITNHSYGRSATMVEAPNMKLLNRTQGRSLEKLEMKENSVTLGKMQELKEKLESLSLQKKGRKSVSTELETAEEKRSQGCKSSHSDKSLLLPKVSHQGLIKAHKEAENIIRMQSKSLSVLVDSDQNHSFRLNCRPLPEIRRTPRELEEKPRDDDSERIKTANRMPSSSIAMLKEENDVGTPAASSIYTSQGSIIDIPGNEDLTVAFSSLPRERVSSTGTRYRSSNLVMKQRPKSTPALVVDKQTRKKVMSALDEVFMMHMLNCAMDTENTGISTFTSKVVPPSSTEQPTLQASTLPTILPPPATKKKHRCLECHKKLNITNMHTCRCMNIFCARHRYSETHNCPFDYKVEGRKLLEQANPLITTSKLPKI